MPLHIGRQVDFRRTDLTLYTDEQLKAIIDAPSNRKMVGILCKQFEFVGPTDRAQFMHNLATVVTLIGDVKPVILLSGWELHAGERHTELNQWLAEAAVRYPNVIVLDINKCIHHKFEVRDATHFDLKVYNRLLKRPLTFWKVCSTRASLGACGAP